MRARTAEPGRGPRTAGRWQGWISLGLLLVLWQVAAAVLATRFLPGPIAVAIQIWVLATEGHLIQDFGRTLWRALLGFVISMLLGTVLGLTLGRYPVLDRLFGNWVVVGLNMPAIVIAILCYIWLGLTETALVLAVVLNKTPLVTTTIREGARSFDPELDELAQAFRLPRGRVLRLIQLPQLLPFLLAAARTGLSLVWKIVLVFEVLGSDGGVGFRISIFFQFFDIRNILAYTSVFIGIVMVIEYMVLRPVEGRLLAWRTDPR